ncbi:MAG: alpha/beta fold hydrolase [Reichenbachiella sp.]
MPIIEHSTYRRPGWLINRHMETILPSAIRKVDIPQIPIRKRVTTADKDFLDIDWYQSKGKKLVILSHGLEGDSKRPYILGMVRKFLRHGWDVMAWNYRGCSEEPNKTSVFYHSGATYDLSCVVGFASQQCFDSISLVGFSLGGNLTLKYLGEEDRSNLITSAAVFSVPLDLEGCCVEIDKSHNWIYSKRFLKSLKGKVEAKKHLINGSANVEAVLNSKSVFEFDDLLTAPLHGFVSAKNYYHKCSAINFIEGINIPTLVVNAESDPFLSKSCFPITKFETSKQVYFEMPKFGGHVGFSSSDIHGVYWSEKRAFDFVSQYS